jgi:hypothetical protein
MLRYLLGSREIHRYLALARSSPSMLALRLAMTSQK